MGAFGSLNARFDKFVALVGLLFHLGWLSRLVPVDFGYDSTALVEEVAEVVE
jgi:hypothetical protein